MREPSASHLALAQLCGHPWTSGIRWPWEPQSSFGYFGDQAHLGAEAHVTGEAVFPAVYAGLDDAERVRLDTCVARARRFLSHMPAYLERHAELELRYHVDSGRVRRAKRGDPREPGEWTVRIDLVLAEPGGRAVHVIDWKTGRQAVTAAATRNPQVRLGALAAARFFGARSATGGLVNLDDEDHGAVEAYFDAFELATIANELRDLRRSLTGGPTPPVPGRHCTEHYCRLRGICAATAAALNSAYPLERPLTTEIHDDDQARFTLERLAGAEARLKAIRAAVQEYAKARPVPLGDGRVYGWRETQEREVFVDTPAREAAVRSVLGDAADFAIRRETTTTIGLLEEAVRVSLGEVPVRGAKTQRLRDVLAALEAAGGLKVKKYDKPEAFKPKGEST